MPHPLSALPLAVAAVLSLSLAAARADDVPAHLTVTGEGRVDAAPDMAIVTLGVQTQAETAAGALAANSERLAAVIERLRAGGIEPRDLQTSGLNLGPRYEYRDNRAPRLVGYEASNQLVVRVRALDRVGAILDAAVADGANTLGGLSFTLADPQPVRDGALAAAVGEARRKAAIIAEAAGITLGPIVSISEQVAYSGPQPMPRLAMADAAEAAVPVEAGELRYAATVTLVYRIAD
ncbi:MAG: SIMPL domain-containing protein [Gemmobacter sp.]